MEPIIVTQTEFYAKDNAKTNKTEEFDLLDNPEAISPILRRGCNFYFSIRFDRNFDAKLDAVRIEFSIGNKPNVLKGTRCVLPVLVKQTTLPNQNNKWSLAVTRVDGEILMLQAFIPASAPVGIWSCKVVTNISGVNDNRKEYQHEQDIYVLFNPWCNDDGVYYEKSDDLKEYILNETGKIWCGTFKNSKSKRWVFGQFDEAVLPAACFLLDKSGLDQAERGSPVLVARAISAVINSADDDGLLEGKWDGDYADGTSPHAWSGTSAIVSQYLATGGQPVKYGQCWVFSAVTVSICRALGIPCRSVTNYVSAHDTNCTLTVDKYFDVFGNKIENGPEGDCSDSCWNFHVWNDVWMARPDLPPGYGGWQIIDATPQEKSDNTFRCGPAPVEAVRKGEVGFLYDTPFVFAEVNADICHFQEDELSNWGFSKLSINKYHVGRKILTKKVNVDDDDGDSDMWDVTRLYKNPEGTEAERLAVFNAAKGIPKAQQFYEIPQHIKNDVFFDLIDIDAIPFGDSFDVTVIIKNESEEARNISAMLSASSVYYTGATAHHIKRSQGRFTVKPGQREVLKINVTANDYLDKLVDHSLIKIYAIANVKETKQTWSEEDDFTLTKPQMDIKVDESNIRIGQECEVSFSFKNPLNMLLNDCTYKVEGPGLQTSKIVRHRNVQPNEFVTIREKFTPKRNGERKIICNFNCKEIQGISGSKTVVIQ